MTTLFRRLFMPVACSIVVFAPAIARAASASVHVCGSYRYDVARAVDGLMINVSADAHTRSIFFRDENSGVSDVKGCSDSELLLTSHVRTGRYSTLDKVFLLDPAQTALQFIKIGTRDAGVAPPQQTDTPAAASAVIQDALSRPADVLDTPAPAVVSTKRAVPDRVSILNDRSYFVLGAQGGLIKKLAPSFWNTTQAIDSVNCASVSYVLYAKKFADNNTATSTFPAVQYVVQRIENGRERIIPIPYEQKGWQDINFWQTTYSAPSFGVCFGKNASVFQRSRVTVVSAASPYVNFSPKTSIEPTYLGDRYYASGGLWYSYGTISGDATIQTLEADGRVTNIKPRFFQDIRQYPDGTHFMFRKSTENQKQVVVGLFYPSTQTNSWIWRYFVDQNGAYVEDASALEDHEPWLTPVNKTTPLYVSPERNALFIRSYFLDGSALVQKMSSSYTVLRNRVGPVESDGARKVVYTLKIGNRTETWVARVR